VGIDSGYIDEPSDIFFYCHQVDTSMSPDEDKIRVTARISKELDTKIHRYYTNMAPAIKEALELLASTKEGTQSPNDTAKDTNGTEELEAKIGYLERQIGDKEREMEFLKGQITIKDQQLDKQAFSLQSVIQENSRLNVKLLPETISAKKPWWRFW
jgi:uncharacterized coiled-coil protein SlyX